MSSSREQDFKQVFDENLRKLQDLNTFIQQKINEKATFSRDVLSELQQINQSIKILAGKFNELNGKLAQLQQEIQSKTSQIADAGNNCFGLQEEITRLQAEIARLQNELADSKHNAEIYKGTVDQNQNKFDIQNKQMEQIIEELKQQLTISKRESDAYNERYRVLTEENTELKRQQNQLSQTIDNITQQIRNLNVTTDTVKPEQITQLLQEINRVIASINNESGSSTGFFGNNSSSSSSSSSSSKIDPNTTISFHGDNYKFGYIIEQLNKKNIENQSNGNANNRYKITLDNISLTSNANTIPGILERNGIEFTNGDIKGGKRRRKSRKTQKKKKARKQKGGYEYSGKSKRRRFSVTRSTSSKRSSSQPMSSSQRSSYETQSSLPNYKARGTKKSKM